MKNLFILCLMFSSGSFAFITIGNDNDCDFNTNFIDSSLLSNEEIRITNQQIYEPIRAINHNANIVGGFNNCADAQNNVTSQTLSIISGNNLATPLEVVTTAARL